jgi:sterol desaturase/sphingolipid hydroxylase (fatty acid hydroxylase superfamily)
MGSEVIIMPAFLGVIFGIYYLYISSRNKERLALIEKGADASIFFSTKKSLTPTWKVFVLNVAVLMMGIGLAIFIANIMHVSFGLDQDVAYPATIFLVGGIALFTGFFLTKKLVEKA